MQLSCYSRPNFRFHCSQVAKEVGALESRMEGFKGCQPTVHTRRWLQLAVGDMCMRLVRRDCQACRAELDLAHAARENPTAIKVDEDGLATRALEAKNVFFNMLHRRAYLQTKKNSNICKMLV